MADVSTAGDDSMPDWGAWASSTFLDLVDNVRDKTTGPLLKVARALVYGIVILVAASMLAVLSLIFLVRFVNNWLPGDVWAAYLLLGLVFFLASAVLWRSRTP
ncbi:MAG: hypothetical protein P8N02_11355 [Actinomycetota bacterium]|nr:hypothetical protein [Actinomycetota bacterium]